MKMSHYLVAGALLLAAIPANATTFLFSLTGSSTANFSLAPSPAPDFSINGISFNLDAVQGTVDGVAGTLDLAFSNTADSGGFSILSSFISTTGAQLYTGTEASPTFRTGTFALSEFGGTGQYSLTITSVPEPAGWAMMLVGFGALGAVMRHGSRAKAKFA
jgi:hypothetical protein